jgi:hypothetical protein
MPLKNTLRQYQVVASQSMTSTITSAPTNIQNLDDVGVQFNFTGAPVGNFRVQVSADYAQDAEGNVQNPGNWVPLLFTYWNGSAFVTSYDIPTTQGSPYYIDLALLSAPFIREVYTPTSGSGTLSIYITAKSVSG